jgi:hypothetical protein
MKKKQEPLGSVLEAIGRQAVPDNLDLWPQIQHKVQRPIRPYQRPFILGAVIVTLIVLAFVLFPTIKTPPVPMAASQAATIAPTPSPAPNSLTSYRGTILLRFKLKLVTPEIKTPYEDWFVYVWFDQDGRQRAELYQVCKDQPVPSHDPSANAEAKRLGARAEFSGPTFERCDKPMSVDIRTSQGRIMINLRDTTPAIAFDQLTDRSYFDPLGMLASPLPLVPDPTDTNFSKLYKAFQSMGYANIGQFKTEVIAGRQAIVFKMDSEPPKNPVPPGAVAEMSRLIWVDAESHLLLGSESLDKDGMSILAWAFTNFEINPDLGADRTLFMYTPDRHLRLWGINWFDEQWQALAEKVNYPLFKPVPSLNNDIFTLRVFPEHPTFNNGMVEQVFVLRVEREDPRGRQIAFKLVQGLPGKLDAPADALEEHVEGFGRAYFYQRSGDKLSEYINRLVVVKNGVAVLLETSGQGSFAASDLLTVAGMLQPVKR